MRIILSYTIYLLPLLIFAQEKQTINGYIEDEETGERLIGAFIRDPISGETTVSNSYGFFSLMLSSQNTLIEVHHLGYATAFEGVDYNKNQLLNISLTPTNIFLKAVAVSGKFSKDSIYNDGHIKLSPKQIEQIPVLLGETDIIKAIQLLPGFQAGNEGTSGLFVRGGGPDQNLILIDGVPVYNVNHLFGFFSTFNNDALNDIQIWKGGFPARYGERLSSVIDISMKEGNNRSFSGKGSVGLLSTKLLFEGPLGSERTSFMVSARRSYFDIFTSIGQEIANGGEYVVGYYFQDFNAKINHRLTKKDRVYLSFYGSKDEFYNRGTDKLSFESSQISDKVDVGLNWNNFISVLRWNRILASNLFLNTSVNFSRYNFEIFERYESTQTVNDNSISLKESSDYNSDIEDLALKMDVEWQPTNDYLVNFGGKLVNHTFKPGVFQLQTDSQADTTYGQSDIAAIELAGYGEVNGNIFNKLYYNLGIRYAGFSVEKKYYSSVQPRLNLRYLISKRLSIHSAYSEMQQFIHLLTNTGVGLPTDLWVPATEKVKPQEAQQLSLGLSYGFENYSISLDGYVKEIKNVISYREGATFLNSSTNWEDKIAVGNGTSAGIELLIRKSTGKTTGWIGYTLSKSTRQFEDINFGKPFPFRYDRRHDVSLVLNHEWKKGAAFSFNWIFQSGNPISVPTSFQPYYDNFTRRYDFRESNRRNTIPTINDLLQTNGIDYVQVFPNRNNVRLRATHRLDLGVRLTKDKKRSIRHLAFGLYNAYSRKNPFYIDWKSDRRGGFQLIQYSFLPILPYISYGFEF